MSLPKFIITRDGFLRMGMVNQYKNLLLPDDDCIAYGCYQKLPINIEELLGRKAVKGYRIKYAFANGFDDTSGGYIVIDVMEKNDLASYHPEFIKEKVVLNKDVVKDVVKDVIKEFGVELSERQIIILEMIYLDSSISAKAMSEKISEKDSVDERTIQRDLSKLKKIGILIRKGGRKNGEWEIVTNRS